MITMGSLDEFLFILSYTSTYNMHINNSKLITIIEIIKMERSHQNYTTIQFLAKFQSVQHQKLLKSVMIDRFSPN